MFHLLLLCLTRVLLPALSLSRGSNKDLLLRQNLFECLHAGTASFWLRTVVLTFESELLRAVVSSKQPEGRNLKFFKLYWFCRLFV